MQRLFKLATLLKLERIPISQNSFTTLMKHQQSSLYEEQKMEAILSRLKQLTADELRQEIIQNGMKCGPITSTTRFLFEKRLAQALLEQGGEAEAKADTDLEQKQSLAPLLSTSAAVQSNRRQQRSSSNFATDSHQGYKPQVSCDCEDGGFGYDVGLNPPDEEALLGKKSSEATMHLQAGFQTHTKEQAASPLSEMSTSPSVYYGVCPVWDDILNRNDRVHIYVDKREALQAVKMMKGSRFKAFSNRADAEKFAKGICDYYPSPNKSTLCTSPVKAGQMFSKGAVFFVSVCKMVVVLLIAEAGRQLSYGANHIYIGWEFVSVVFLGVFIHVLLGHGCTWISASRRNYVDRADEPILPENITSPEVDTISRERANSFKSPRTQDLTAKLRKSVEQGDQAAFLELVHSNPRYLIGSGDNPTVVQEGCRYNVMHVAAKENQPGICHLLLDTLENPEFMRLMYPDDDETMLQKRILYIVDLYLNTPDKVGFDTPLHFACKFGHAEVVNVLCAHPDVQKNARNKYNQTPEDVICERSKIKSQELKEKIKEYLQERCYIPLLRAEDNSTAPVIGTPWSPDPCDTASFVIGPRHFGSPKDPVLAVRAFAGPMSPSKAEEFRRIWKTPPRDKACFFHHVKKSDPDRGIERVGRELAHDLGYPWNEYWEFLHCFTDLASFEGLRKLEDYLSKKEAQERSRVETGENESCSRFKTPLPSARSRACCNSVSVGAFLEEHDDMSLEEIKNRHNAARKINHPKAQTESRIDSIEDSVSPIISINQNMDILETGNGASLDYQKGMSPPVNGFSSPVNKKTNAERRQSHDKSECALSPVSNLMMEFEKLSVQRQEDLKSSYESRQMFGTELDCKDPKSKTDVCVGLNHLRISVDCNSESVAECIRIGGITNLKDMENSSNTSVRTDGIMLSGMAQAGLTSPDLPSHTEACSSSEARQKQLIKTPPLNEPALQMLFIGVEPSKVDVDVLAALSNTDISPQKYPSIHRWKSSVLSFPSNIRQSWQSPALWKGWHKSQSFTLDSSNLPLSATGVNSVVTCSPGNCAASPLSSEFGSPGRYSPAYASHIQFLKRHHFTEASAL